MAAARDGVMEYAMGIVLRLNSLFKEMASRGMLKTDDAGRPIVDPVLRRATDLPSLVLQVGLVPAATFYLGKLTEGKLAATYTMLYNYLVGGTAPSAKSLEVLVEVLGKDAGGYPVLLAVLAALLHRYAEADKCRGDLSTPERLAACLKELLEKNTIALESMVVEGLTTVKRLANALFAKKQREGEG